MKTLKFVVVLGLSSLLNTFCFLELQIQRLSGVDSDFAPFVQHAGVPSIDMYYGRGTYLISRRFCLIYVKSCNTKLNDL